MPDKKVKNEDFDQPSELMKKTLVLITKSKLTFEQISQKTGISKSWIAKFSCGIFTNPSVNRVEFLYNFLSKKPLFKK